MYIPSLLWAWTKPVESPRFGGSWGPDILECIFRLTHRTSLYCAVIDGVEFSIDCCCCLESIPPPSPNPTDRAAFRKQLTEKKEENQSSGTGTI